MANISALCFVLTQDNMVVVRPSRKPRRRFGRRWPLQARLWDGGEDGDESGDAIDDGGVKIGENLAKEKDEMVLVKTREGGTGAPGRGRHIEPAARIDVRMFSTKTEHCIEMHKHTQQTQTHMHINGGTQRRYHGQGMRVTEERD